MSIQATTLHPVEHGADELERLAVEAIRLADACLARARRLRERCAPQELGQCRLCERPMPAAIAREDDLCASCRVAMLEQCRQDLESEVEAPQVVALEDCAPMVPPPGTDQDDPRGPSNWSRLEMRRRVRSGEGSVASVASERWPCRDGEMRQFPEAMVRGWVAGRHEL